MAEINKIKIGGDTYDIIPAPIFAANPAVAVAQASAAVSFSVSGAVFGSGVTYQWQISTNSGATWANSTLTGAKTNTLSITATAARNGYMYRCIAKYNGNSETSAPCKLVVLS